ncbi:MULTISPECIES: hypothetical protein [Nocardia]|uniref:hypothetical protein n=1 Tax=Nocardia TaxID=1817 RepID=UPI000D6901DF|nr:MULTISPECIES: hypothetical protein [Nocardia]
MPINAIGLINLEHSPADPAAHLVITALARTRGLFLAHTLTIDADTYMPTALIVATAHKHHAATILAPTLEHFGPSPKAVALTCTLVIPTLTIPAAGSWNPNH